jgi:hypothetical protein
MKNAVQSSRFKVQRQQAGRTLNLEPGTLNYFLFVSRET